MTYLSPLSRLEEQDGDLAEVEVEEMLGLVGDIGTEVAAHDAMPGGVVLLVELLLDVGGDVLLDVELLHCLSGDLNSVGLHVLGHIGVLDHSLAVSGSHCGSKSRRKGEGGKSTAQMEQMQIVNRQTERLTGKVHFKHVKERGECVVRGE